METSHNTTYKNMPHHNGNKLQHTKNISIAQRKQVATKAKLA